MRRSHFTVRNSNSSSEIITDSSAFSSYSHQPSASLRSAWATLEEFSCGGGSLSLSLSSPSPSEVRFDSFRFRNLRKLIGSAV